MCKLIIFKWIGNKFDYTLLDNKYAFFSNLAEETESWLKEIYKLETNVTCYQGQESVLAWLYGIPGHSKADTLDFLAVRQCRIITI